MLKGTLLVLVICLAGPVGAQELAAIEPLAPPALQAGSDPATVKTDPNSFATALTKGTLPVLGGSIAVMALGNDRDQRNARRFLDAQLATGLVTELLKEVVRQERPNSPGEKTGFPSGHASAVAAWSVCMAKAYPQWRWPAYGFSALVCWSRVDLRRHTTFQVVAGAALGGWLADRSWESRGGLFRGLIVKEDPVAPTLLSAATQGFDLGEALPKPAGLAFSPDAVELTLWARNW